MTACCTEGLQSIETTAIVNRLTKEQREAGEEWTYSPI